MISIPGRWTKICYFHFKLPAGTLRHLVPDSLEIVEIAGTAWLTIVYFLSEILYQDEGILPYNGLNVRTYVRPQDGGPVGVYFLRLYTDSSGVALIGKALGLPYQTATINIGKLENLGGFPDETIIVTTSSGQQPLLSATFQRAEETSPHIQLARQLSDQRYGYHALRGRCTLQLEVRHSPFELCSAKIVTEAAVGNPIQGEDGGLRFWPGADESQFEARPLFEQLGIVPPTEPPLVFCSPGGEVKQLLPRLYRVRNLDRLSFALFTR